VRFPPGAWVQGGEGRGGGRMRKVAGLRTAEKTKFFEGMSTKGVRGGGIIMRCIGVLVRITKKQDLFW